jgi:hypothetical protein
MLMKAQRGGGVIVPDIRNMGSRTGGRSARRPGRFTRGKMPVPLVQELCRSRGQSGRARRISPH